MSKEQPEVLIKIKTEKDEENKKTNTQSNKKAEILIDDSSVAMELIDSISANCLVDKIYRLAIALLIFIMISGVLWGSSKFNTKASELLEHISVVIFIITLLMFTLAGSVFLCTTFIIEKCEIKNEESDQMSIHLRENVLPSNI